MSSIRAAARAALARKQKEQASGKARSGEDAGDVAAKVGEVAFERRGAAATSTASGRTSTKSRWGSSDEESDDGAAEVQTGPEGPETAPPSTQGQGYLEKMLAEANSFAAAQRVLRDSAKMRPEKSRTLDPQSFSAPSPSSSEEGCAESSPEAGPVRPTLHKAVSQTLVGELAALDSDEEQEPKAGPMRREPMKHDGDRDEDFMVGPARPDTEALRLLTRDEHTSSRQIVGTGTQFMTAIPTSMPSLKKRSLNMLEACRSVDEFERLKKIDEGTYGIVFKARDKKTGEVAALKRVKMDEVADGFPLTALREVNILLSLDHPSIVNVNEVVVGSKLNFVFMVMEYVENDLKGLMDQMAKSSTPNFTIPEVKDLMLQLLSGMSYLHENWIMHRDLKMSNILVTNSGNLKICDFGLARQFEGVAKYTQLVVTLWYRAPELLLGATTYGPAIDVWSLGCIFGELLSGSPLFNGQAEIDQLQKIFKMLGTPNDRIWPEFSSLPSVKTVTFAEQPYNKLRQKFPRDSTGLSDKGFELLNRMLTYDPAKRFTCDDALNDPFFAEFPHPQRPVFLEG